MCTKEIFLSKPVFSADSGNVPVIIVGLLSVNLNTDSTSSTVASEYSDPLKKNPYR